MTNIHPSAKIHPTAIIEEGAKIGSDCMIGPYTVIGAHVVLGPENRVSAHVVIDGYTNLGAQNQIFQFASVGAVPQDLKYRGEASELRIGDRNIIREYTTLQPGTAGGGMLTSIGDQNLFMACTHVGHDCHIGSENIFANNATLAGHVRIANQVIVGGLCGVHQFVRVGDLAMLAAGAMIAQDVPPYCMVQGDRAAAVGLNLVGLKRKGFSADDISVIKELYRSFFLRQGPRDSKLAVILEKFGDHDLVRCWTDFIRQSERGIVSVSKRGEENQ